MSKSEKVDAFKTAVRSFVNSILTSHNNDSNAHISLLNGYATVNHAHNNYVSSSSLSDVAFSGDYEDLTNIPTNTTLLNMTVLYTDDTTTTIPLLVTTSTIVNNVQE